MRLLRSVWCQFVLIGVVLFVLDRALFPEPKPIIGPPNAERVALQVQALTQLQGKPLSSAQQQMIKARELRDELLFMEALHRGFIEDDLVVQRRLIRNMRFMDPEQDAEDSQLLTRALELRLHLADEVIRRRTVQVMETLIVASRGESSISEATLRAAYQSQLDLFEEPTRYSFSHVFLRNEASQARVEQLVTALSEGASLADARALGDVFLAGYTFKDRSLAEISRQFGDGFTQRFSVKAERLGQWVGPLQSIFGNHWVWVEDIAESRVKRFDEVAQDVARDIRRDRDRETIENWVDATLAGYEVLL
ncbi:peptidylprolyl isomerase [Luminiphilus sp.]|nr:peptidylprolyl isomerase [Luminiphilus sp.]